ncbi:sialate O-acetylesterase [Marinivivus vitaminiproducens]|uniref:sialate O-acetylesterase n=1 Tax=Marinivivus vitaminiproducens TaxID=3035935 RepID=UPI00279CD097|nr:sialate O-acetylesterase [Geminicoccaceae bacterium SCSIO 64248]
MSTLSIGLGGTGPGPGGVVTASAAFDPATVLGLSWWDADRAEQFAEADGAVLSWSAGGARLSTADGAKRPVRVPNVVAGRAGVRFDGVDDELGLENALSDLGMLVLVFRPAAGVTAATAGQTLLRLQTGTESRIVLGDYMAGVNDELLTLRQGGAAIGLFDGGWTLPAATQVLIVRRHPTSRYGFEMRLNGAPITHRPVGAMAAIAMSHVMLGGNGGSSFFRGDVLALGLSGLTSTSMMRQLERYCLQRWEVPVRLQGVSYRMVAGLGQSLAEHMFLRNLSAVQAGIRSHLNVELGLSLNLATGGSAIMKVSNPANYWWDQDMDGPGPLLDEAIAHVKSAGLVLDAMVWRIGEADSTKVGLSFTSEQWQADFAKVITHFREQTGQLALPAFIVATGRRDQGFGNDPGIDMIRDGENALCDGGLENCHLAADVWDLELADGLHLTDAGYVRAIERTFRFIGGHFQLAGQRSLIGPRLTAAELEDATHIVCTLAHDSGTDLAPATGMKGFAVTDSTGQALAVTDASRLSATRVRLTLAASVPPGSLSVHMARRGPIGALANADLASVCRDNTPLALPVRPGRVTATQAWSPHALTNLAAWLSTKGTGTLRDDDAGGATYAGVLASAPAAVGAWRIVQLDDLSGRGRHATEATAAAQPVFNRSAQEMVMEAGQGLQIPHDPVFNPSANPWIYVVFDIPATTVGPNHLIGKGNGAASPGWRVNEFSTSGTTASTTALYATHSGDPQKVVSVLYGSTARRRVIGWFGFDAAARVLRTGWNENQVAQANWNAGATAATAMDTSDPVRLGGSTVYNWDGTLMEVLVCTGEPAAADKAQIVSYLKTRWSIA